MGPAVASANSLHGVLGDAESPPQASGLFVWTRPNRQHIGGSQFGAMVRLAAKRSNPKRQRRTGARRPIPTLAHHVGDIVVMRPDEQVRRIHARRVVAAMENPLAVGKRRA